MKRKPDYQSQVIELRQALWEVYITKEVPLHLKNIVKKTLMGEDYLPAPGDRVNWHSVIGKDVTLAGVQVRSVAMLHDGRVHVWLEGRAGGHPLAAISRYEEETE